MGALTDFARKARTFVIGGARSVEDPELFKKISLVALLAWVGLGADGLSSACYGPEEAFVALGVHVPLGIFVAAATMITIFVIAASYSQIVEVFPSGGGGYLVASKLLSPGLGMASGCALLVDYVLTISISIASGTDALFSSLPERWQPYKLVVASAGVLLLLVMNLRGVRESVMTLTPIFLLFVLTHIVAVVYPIVVHAPEIGAHAARTSNEVSLGGASGLGTLGMVFLILRAYSLGAGTFTGIEAVSNSMPILREPRVLTAKRTMRYMAISLAFMAAGLMIGYILYDLHSEPGRTLNATLFNRITEGWGPLGPVFVTVGLLSEAVFLFAAAQTGFLGAPRVLSYMSMDRWFPQQFSLLSERFVIKNGLALTGIAALLTLILTKGSVRFLVVLYSINVFITFTLSQLGMVRHWLRGRGRNVAWRKKIAVNGVGLVLTVFILASMIVLKFREGGWITIFITGTLMLIAGAIRRFYGRTQKQLSHLDTLVQVVEATRQENHRGAAGRRRLRYNTKARTAVILVSGFNGMGLHTLFNVVRLFGKGVRNFFFIQAGIIDAETFKGKDELASLEEHVKASLDRYVDYVRNQGFYARGYPLLATDVVDEVSSLSQEIFRDHPSAIFFGGRIVFKEETILTRMLYNYVTFAVQRRLHQSGIPFVIVPVPVSADLIPGARPTLARAEATYKPAVAPEEVPGNPAS